MYYQNIKYKYNIILIYRKITLYIKDFVEILFISLTGLIGLIFIMTTPFDPPEERNKPLYRRLKKLLRD